MLSIPSVAMTWLCCCASLKLVKPINEGTSISVPSLELVIGRLGFSQIAASRDLAGELAWRPLAERSVRTTLIVFSSPSFDKPPCLVQVSEPVGIQTFGTEGAIERFDEGVVSWLARTREVDLHPVLVSPQIHCLTGELASVIAEQQFRHSALAL